ncbi:hypothetical protein [Halalkalibacter krulwichiae]|uniref:Uncharacterized protein n=1 Tax=Halalkalibacter krulwichiae TaxID=199441 RepID=A0A1X9MBX7_9BACI|nr:hypothetical protein [Halalkalibacter krulwichiae]ARK30100.1 hypothetical protein BkAM31D_09665 [Halalkalibacter krulwichiae]
MANSSIKHDSHDDIVYISLDKIVPLYSPNVTGVFLNRMKGNFQHLSTFDLLFPVEKDPKKDEYILVGKYDYYHFIVNKTLMKTVPCILEPYSGRVSQYFKLLRRSHPSGEQTKSTRQSVLKLLESRKVIWKTVIQYTSLTKKELSDLKYNPTVPAEHINAYTTEITLNWIDNQAFRPEVKKFLYKRAGLPYRDQKRLTDERRKFIVSFLNREKRFAMLTDSQQIKILTKAINFKATMFDHLKMLIDDYLS